MDPRRLAACFALSILGLAGACDTQVEPPADAALRHLRHWVPYRSTSGLFFLHRFELREEDVQRVLPHWGSVHRSPTPDLPAVNLNQVQAWAVARAYLARLPSLSEWRYAVGGDIGFRFPWGNRKPNPSYANTLELGLQRRTRVGTFESGRDPTGQGCYDLIGNVAEWTSTPLALHPHAVQVLAGSFVSQLEQLRRSEDLLPVSPFLGGVVPWMPELLDVDEMGRQRFCTLGFSFSESLQARETPDAIRYLMVEGYWDDQGTIPRGVGESGSQLGLRLATDPYTFMARLETHAGSVTAGDLLALEDFLSAYRMDFERVARLRAGLDRASLGCKAPSELALEAWRILGVQP